MALGYIPGLARVKENNLIATKNFNRDNLKPLTGKGARAQRAIDNLYESLPAFVIVVLLVHITDSYNDIDTTRGTFISHWTINASHFVYLWQTIFTLNKLYGGVNRDYSHGATTRITRHRLLVNALSPV